MILDNKIYKYCSYKDGDLIVSGQNLKFSNPSSFNDPFDCDIDLLEFNYEDCSQEIIDDMEELKRNLSKTWGTDVSETIDDIPQEKVEEIYKNNQIKKIKKSSICCFSKIHNSITMWSYYADKHNGICLVFDPFVKDPFTELSSKQCSEGSVIYDHNTSINYLKSKREGIEKLFFTKSNSWKLEEEFRYIIHKNVGLLKFKKSFFRGVIFGLRVKEEAIHQFINICDNKGYDGLFFGKFTKNKLQLELNILNRK
ncbi:DUF2971 domain-containing protein [Flavobacteriaceae bacterium]|nr:DUF2971 domain-containing protein [Flavobacteriaceae bacterium]